MTIVALIPARFGSKRIPGKNTKLLAGQPLIAYTIAAAQQSGIFADVVVSSEDDRTLSLAESYGVCPLWRPPTLASDSAPDIGWVRFSLSRLRELTTDTYEAFA